MSHALRPMVDASPVITRLSKLAPLQERDMAALQAAQRDTHTFKARAELIREGEPIRQPSALSSGWAMRQRILLEGQRQILNYLLPGDLIGACRHSNPLAATTVICVTEVTTCRVPDAEPGSALSEAIARSAALEEHYLMAQITRIGRLDAYERIVDWLLETSDRLMLVGMATPTSFSLPLTQELVADTLGLTSVHVNRMMQSLRRDGLLTSQSGVFSFPNRTRIERLVAYRPIRVSIDA